MKKRISVLIPTYNEEENVVPLSEAIVAAVSYTHLTLPTILRV